MTPPALDTNPYWSIDEAAGAQYGVPAALLSAQQWYESNWEPDGPTSSTGAEGIAQFEPATAAAYGINPLDPSQAIPAEAQYLANAEKEFGSWAAAVSAYDAGVGAVAANNGQVVPDTAQYVNNVITAAAAATGTAATPTAGLTSSTPSATGVVSGAASDVAGALGLTSNIESELLEGGVYLLLLGAGIGLVVAGAFKLANPGKSITQTAKTGASALALAA